MTYVMLIYFPQISQTIFKEHEKLESSEFD